MRSLKRPMPQSGLEQKRRKIYHQDTQPTATGQNRLLELPGELRNQVYEYVFSDQTIEVGEDGKVPAEPFALLRTCRQVYCEARLIPHIQFTYVAATAHGFEAWLKDMPQDQRDAITSLCFRFYPSRPKRATRFNFDMSVWFGDSDEGVPPWLVEPAIDLKHLAGLKRLHVRGTYHVDTESVDNSLGHMKDLVQEINPGLEITTDAQFNPDVETYEDRMDEMNARFFRSVGVVPWSNR